jgi:hypothetical protein
MRTRIYARVSTQHQAQADGLAQQIDRLQATPFSRVGASPLSTSSAMMAIAGLNSHGQVKFRGVVNRWLGSVTGRSRSPIAVCVQMILFLSDSDQSAPHFFMVPTMLSL